MAEEQKCPKCGAELPANAPEGLCPRCLIKLGVQTGEQVSGVDSEMPSDVPTSPPADGGPDRFVPPEPAEMLARQVPVPVIGCGAGPGCDGFVVVTHDMLGLTGRKTPKFVTQYSDLHAPMLEAFRGYVSDCRGGSYPADEHNYPMSPEEVATLTEWARARPAAGGAE